MSLSAVEKLRTAVAEMPEGASAFGDSHTRSFWSDYGRSSIHHWADDIERNLVRLAEVVDQAGRADRSEEGIRCLEEALWRGAATREKLEALFALCFGVPALKKYKDGIAFEPNTKSAIAKLRDLARSYPAASRLQVATHKLLKHPTRTLRNQLSHSLVAIGDPREVMCVQVAHMEGTRSIRHWELKIIYHEHLLDEEGGIGADQVFGRTCVWCREMREGLLDATDALADLIAVAAVLEPPQSVWRDDATGKMYLEDPRPREPLWDSAQ